MQEDKNYYAKSELGPSVPWSEDPRSESMLEAHKNEGGIGFKFTDREILSEAKKLIKENPGLDASEISVSVENHCVVLEGYVKTKKEKELTFFLMENLSGIRSVLNYLHIKM